MTKARMNLLVLFTENLENTKHFYETIGLKFKEEKHGAGHKHYSCTFEDGLVLEIYPKGNGTVPNVRLGFEVENIQTVLEVLRPSHYTDLGDCVVIRDPDNRPIELREKAKGKQK